MEPSRHDGVVRRAAALLITVLMVPTVVFGVVRYSDPGLAMFIGLLVVGSLASAVLYTVLADGPRSLRTSRR